MNVLCNWDGRRNNLQTNRSIDNPQELFVCSEKSREFRHTCKDMLRIIGDSVSRLKEEQQKLEREVCCLSSFSSATLMRSSCFTSIHFWIPVHVVHVSSSCHCIFILFRVSNSIQRKTEDTETDFSAPSQPTASQQSDAEECNCCQNWCLFGKKCITS